jgi:integrase/recombinase XerD
MATRTLPLDIEEFLTYLAIEKGRSANTLAAYRQDLRKYVAYLDGREINVVSSEDVIGFLRYLNESGLARSSVNRSMTTVRGMHRFLFAEGVLPHDPTADVEPARLPKGLPKALSEGDITALIDAASNDDPFGRRDRALLEVLYGTGMRISECVGLSLDDVDIEAALLRVTGKGDKQRLVPLGRLAEAALAEWLEPGGRSALAPEVWKTRSDQMAVFLNHRGGRLSRQGIWGVVRKHGLTAGIAERLTPHVLRHSCATHMLDHGADIRTVQELLGHASISTTQLYTKVSTELLVRAYTSAHPRASGRPGVHR